EHGRVLPIDLEDRADLPRLGKTDLPPPAGRAALAFPGGARLQREPLAVDGALGAEPSLRGGGCSIVARCVGHTLRFLSSRHRATAVTATEAANSSRDTFPAKVRPRRAGPLLTSLHRQGHLIVSTSAEPRP